MRKWGLVAPSAGMRRDKASSRARSRSVMEADSDTPDPREIFTLCRARVGRSPVSVVEVDHRQIRSHVWVVGVLLHPIAFLLQRHFIGPQHRQLISRRSGSESVWASDGLARVGLGWPIGEHCCDISSVFSCIRSIEAKWEARQSATKS